MVVADDPARENEGDLIFAAEAATTQLVAFTVRHTSGFLCVALPEETCRRLWLQPITHRNQDRHGTAYQVPVDLRGTGTGISATARAQTIVALSTPEANAEDFLRPGHVVPLQAKAGGVRERPGHTEAAVDLMRLAGMRQAAALCEIVSTEDPTRMAAGSELTRFATEHGLVVVYIADIAEHLRRTTRLDLTLTDPVALPTEHGHLRAFGVRDDASNAEHLVVFGGDSIAETDHSEVRVHRECLLGNTFRSAGCECGRRLAEELRRIAENNRGMIIYLRQGSRDIANGFTCPWGAEDAHTDALARAILAELGTPTVRDGTFAEGRWRPRARTHSGATA